MNRPGWYRVAGALLERVIIVILLAALLGVAFITAYPDYVYAGGNVSVTRNFEPTAEAFETDGDGNGFQTTPYNAYADDTSYAVDTDSGNGDNTTPTAAGADKHQYYNYGIDSIPIPTNSTIDGITVRADIAVDGTAHNPFTAIQLSWNGGANWTTAKNQPLTAKAETTYTYGGTADDWGRTWAVSELSNANFRVRVINGDTHATQNQRDFSLDYIPVSITFTAPWDSYEDSGRTINQETFTSSHTYTYMKGTGFPAGNYDVGYYDADGQKVITDANVSITGSQYLLIYDPFATAGLWHALVQPTGGNALPSGYGTAIGDPDFYNLIANDSFTVQPSAIPEFSTVIAGIVVAVTCFGIFYWMRKRRLAHVKI